MGTPINIKCTCDNCGKNFIPMYHNKKQLEKAKHHYCSIECKKEYYKSHLNNNVVCVICGRPYHVKPSRLSKTKCCSRECLKKLKQQQMSGQGNHQYGLKGDKNPTWKSDERISQYGYKQIRVLDHPFRNNQDFVFEHRLVAEQYLLTPENSIEINGKRYLRKEYDVHHIDQNKLNNEVTNLMVLTKIEHRRLHGKLQLRERDDKTGKFVSAKAGSTGEQ